MATDVPSLIAREAGSSVAGPASPETPGGDDTLPVVPSGAFQMILRHGDHGDPLVPEPMR